ncbi:S-adenosyl-L-methionine-dependent methyltransferase [Lizonia empirigonia]|nr:S-adenosyl-L-methionine-dependent methyltransferase [Lizonia empirigonia]
MQDSDSSGPTVRSVESDVVLVTSKQRCDVRSRSDYSISLPDAEMSEYKLSNGNIITPGDTVELVDQSTHDLNAMHSGDFLCIKNLIKDLRTDEVRIRGYLMHRAKYLRQIFDSDALSGKINELTMVLCVDEDDKRSPFLAGLEDVAVDEVLRKRDGVLTNKVFPFQSFPNEESFLRIPSFTSKEDAKRRIFHEGRLCCRTVYIRYIRHTGKDTSGVVRHLYNAEINKICPALPSSVPRLSRQSSLIIDGDEGIELLPQAKRSISDSLELLDSPPRRKSLSPVKKYRYTFADMFCGAGGASQGAVQAGLQVCWGLDNDEAALNAYHLNHPGALPFCQNSHHFPPNGFTTSDLRVDVLHLSPPCCYWSPAHTQNGQNDQANYEAIYTVGPILKAVKPRVATLEQTFGLMTHEQHQRNFKMLLYDIGKAGYDLRYKLQDMSRLGLVQKRRRLLIIAARRGTPLPPFPDETHGEAGSGLKPFVLISDALKVMSRLGPRALNDEYHQPKPMTTPKLPYDPRAFLKGCITTNGGDNYHYEGQRKYTVREMSLFQSFSYFYQFNGKNTQAMKQVGNAFTPVIAEAMYRSVVATLKAFDKGLIGAEDDLTDLDGVLAQSRLNSSNTSTTPPSPFDNPSSRTRPQLQNSRETFALPGRKLMNQTRRSRTSRDQTCPEISSFSGLLDGSSDSSFNRGTSSLDQKSADVGENDSDEDDVIYLGSSRKSE